MNIKWNRIKRSSGDDYVIDGIDYLFLTKEIKYGSRSLFNLAEQDPKDVYLWTIEAEFNGKQYRKFLPENTTLAQAKKKAVEFLFTKILCLI